MDTAGQFDVTADQGATFELSFQLFQDTARTLPQSLSGAVVSGKIRKAPESIAVIATFVGTVVDGPNGVGKVTLSAAITAAIACDNSGAGNRKLTTFVYDIEALYADNTVQRVLEGNFYVSPEVSKP